jgi:hypothetical protein
MPTAVANLNTDTYTRINIGQNPITLQALKETVRIVFSEAQPVKGTPVFHPLQGDSAPWRIEYNDTNVWALATCDEGSLVVTEHPDGRAPVDMGALLTNRFDLAVAAGLVEGATPLTKFGVNAAAPLSTIDLWDVGGDYTFLTAAETLQLSSDDADDNAAGTGARTVEIFGLDANYDAISEIVTLNGVVPVLTANQYIRCNRMIIRTAGSNGGAEGTVVTETAGGTIQAQVNNGFNQSLMAIWTVPAGKVFIIKYTEASIGKGKEGLFELKVRPPGEVFQTKKALKVFEKKSATRREFGGVIDEKSDIKINVTSDSNNAFVEGEFEGIILDKAIFGIA